MKNLMLSFLSVFIILTKLYAQPWSEDFNSQHSNSYGTSYTINSRTWTCKDAGNFSYANTSMGSYAFTINDDKAGAHITTPALNTCGEISFKYAYKNGNSSNVFKLQKSTNGTTFTTIDTRTLGASANLSYVNYSFTVNDNSSTIYIRILSDNQNAHLFIEDFSVTAYSSNSNESEIVKKSGWSEPTNIAYATYSATSSLTSSNSLEVAKFTIKDGGSDGTDSDSKSTKLTDISFTITNYDNLAAIAIFDGTTNISEVTSISSSTVSFSSLTLEAPDESTKDFSLRATFKSSVTDNQNLKYAISSATADNGGSVFANSDAGGAETDNTGNNNKIVVTADRLAFTNNKPPSTVTLNSGFDVEVEATDANNNRDLDATNSITLSKASGTGTLSSATGLTQSLSSGIYSWSDVKYNTEEDFTITASATGLTSITSGTITCSTGPPDLIISEVADPGDNYKARFVELYNNSGSTIDFSSTTFYLCKQVNGGSWYDVQLSGSVLDGEMFVIATNSSDHNTYYGSSPDQANGNISGNGDDGYFLYYGGNHSSGTLVDAFGVINEDGTGKSWEYEDSRAVRTKNSKSKAKGSTTFNSSDWEITAADVADMTPGTKDGNQTLPIKITRFSVIQQDDSKIIIWQTASEINNNYFVLESSYDCKEFFEVATVKGAGNSKTLIDYSVKDYTNHKGMIYYRLKQVDFDGSYSYSKIISINTDNNTLTISKVYHQGTTLFINLNGTQNSHTKIDIISIDGKIINTYNIELNKGQKQYKLFIGNKLKGIYLIRIENKTTSVLKKLII